MRTIQATLLIAFLISLKLQAQDNIIRIGNDIELTKISESAYIHTSHAQLENTGRFASNGMILINHHEAFLLDTPVNDSLTQILVCWIVDTMKMNLVGFIPNHWHIDCIGGLSYLNSIGINSYANQMTINICKDKGLPTPKVGFTDSISLSIGNINIQSYFFGAAHSLDNVVVWIPSEKILFGGCMIKSINAQGLGNTVDGNLIQWPRTIDKLIGKFRNVQFVIPGHGSFGGTELLTHTKDLLATD